MNDEKYTKKLQARQVIKCPHCGWEYLPGEIFYPDNVVGQPIDEVRDPLGKILYEDYKEDCEPLAEEHFYCENCGKAFVVEVEMKFKAKPEDEELDFSSTTSTLF